ncbi:hypothetical protein ES708_29923 [subsurface metagenome]
MLKACRMLAILSPVLKISSRLKSQPETAFIKSIKASTSGSAQKPKMQVPVQLTTWLKSLPSLWASLRPLNALGSCSGSSMPGIGIPGPWVWRAGVASIR